MFCSRNSNYPSIEKPRLVNFFQMYWLFSKIIILTLLMYHQNNSVLAYFDLVQLIYLAAVSSVIQEPSQWSFAGNLPESAKRDFKFLFSPQMLEHAREHSPE